MLHLDCVSVSLKFLDYCLADIMLHTGIQSAITECAKQEDYKLFQSDKVRIHAVHAVLPKNLWFVLPHTNLNAQQENRILVNRLTPLCLTVFSLGLFTLCQ